MKSKEPVFLITGGTSGVGKATAMGLAQKGAKVVIVSRHAEQCERVMQEIADRTNNYKGDYMIADLSLQSSIRRLAEEFKRKYDRIQVLVNCVGAIFNKRQFTTDRIERSFAINYMSHFVLTNELLDILEDSGPSRVLTVTGSPVFLRHAKIDFNDLQDVRNFNGTRAAIHATYLRLIFSFELARRLQGLKVTSNAFFPGQIKTNLSVNLAWYMRLVSAFTNMFARNVCEVTTYLSTSPEVASVSGRFFDKDNSMIPLQEKFDSKVGEELWARSEALLVQRDYAATV